jgi:hypothetical protein
MQSFVTRREEICVDDYCANLKSLANVLSDVGETITDETLVFTVLDGLNK